MKKISFISIVFILALFFFLNFDLTLAQNSWVAPPQGTQPPSGNTYPPLDTSSNWQKKTGGLTIGEATSQTEKLEVVDNTGSTARLRVTDTTQNPEIQWHFGAGANDHWSIYVDNSTDRLVVWGVGATGANRMVITTDGKIGVGVNLSTEPAARLEVKEITALGTTLGNYQLLETVGGMAGSNYLKNNLWLYRDANGSGWDTARLFDGISVDTSWTTPHSSNGPRVWFERDPNSQEFAWGSGANTYMTLIQGRLTFNTSNPHGGIFEANMGNNDNYFSIQNDNNIGVLLRSGTTGGMPYIDFSNDLTMADARIILEANALLRVSNANLKVGNPSAPGGGYSASGDINAQRMCLNGNCISSWPSGSGGLAYPTQIKETEPLSTGVHNADFLEGSYVNGWQGIKGFAESNGCASPWRVCQAWEVAYLYSQGASTGSCDTQAYDDLNSCLGWVVGPVSVSGTGGDCDGYANSSSNLIHSSIWYVDQWGYATCNSNLPVLCCQ